ncbi:uncharacterized protein LTR77_003509 [Saxophila tyrrhenica]|uniref:Uncharacterized protein n=1 Tax=Saxophila tyrrhenica TaxID=1690608 RepID=A0AAV9PI19_9PEZI|nr:hypothetical protein LTR77_003509 [Saxophila tyrrhenica]
MAVDSEGVAQATICDAATRTDIIDQPGKKANELRDKALGLDLILIEIICSLSPADMQQAKKNSKQARLASTLTPTTTTAHTDEPDSRFLADRTACCEPCYTTSKLAYNPALSWIYLAACPGGLRHFQLDQEKETVPGEINGVLEEFVTSPRCSAVTVKADFCDGAGNEADLHCMVYVPTGVKVKDVVWYSGTLQDELKKEGKHCDGLIGEVAWVGGSDHAWIHTTVLGEDQDDFD